MFHPTPRPRHVKRAPFQSMVEHRRNPSGNPIAPSYVELEAGLTPFVVVDGALRLQHVYVDHLPDFTTVARLGEPDER